MVRLVRNLMSQGSIKFADGFVCVGSREKLKDPNRRQGSMMALLRRQLSNFRMIVEESKRVGGEAKKYITGKTPSENDDAAMALIIFYFHMFMWTQGPKGSVIVV